jgi:1,4-dihydroxy-2-naphthoyl-CoA hydrolase
VTNSVPATPDPGSRPTSPEALLDLMPFAQLMGATFSTVAPEEVRARLDWSPQVCTSGRRIHGGAVMALADSSGAICAFLNLPAAAKATTTVESKTNFLRGVTAGFIEATSRPLHIGRTVIVVETDVRDADDKLVARVTQTQLVLSA